MAKKKAQQALRNTERLLNAGRYWEWLDTVKAENLEGQYPREREQVWKSLTRKALRLPRDFNEFCAKIEGRDAPPNLPDFEFLLALKRFIESGDGARNELEGLKGLSAPALMLKERALAWSEKTFPGEKLAALLQTMVEHPENVTQRHYDQLAKALAGSNLAEPVKKLGAHLRDFRQLNYQSMVKRGWNCIEFHELETMDQLATVHSKSLPESLRRIVLLPYCSQVAILVRRLAAEGPADMARLVRCFEHLFPLVAGDRLEELNGKLLLTGAKPASNQSAVQMWSQIETKPLEDKLVLLNRMRLTIGRKAMDDDDFPDPFELFDDDLDDEHIEQLKVFRGLYQQVLGEVAARAVDIPAREQKELRRVLEQLLATDWRLLVDDPGDVEEMAAFLRRLLSVGFAGKQMALLALVVAKRNRSASLQSAAEKVLEQSLPVSEQDLRWLLDEFGPLYFPSIRALAPVIDRCCGDSTLTRVIVSHLFEKTEQLLFTNSLVTGRRSFLSIMFGQEAGNMVKEFQTLRRELDQLHGCEEQLGPLRVFVSCFAEGFFTRDGFSRWLTYAHGRESWFSYLKTILTIISRRSRDAASNPFQFVDVEDVWKVQGEAVLHFMKQHMDDFRTMDLAMVSDFIDLVARLKKVVKQDPSILVRINNILDERLQAGEKEAEAVQREVIRLLQTLAKPKTKARKTRKGRR